ncbi:MAG: hypothetical protein ABIL09_04315 [Gemmatimonadota bacterium]
MTRDQYLLTGLILLFVAVNAAFLATGTLAVSWDGFGVIVAAGLTLALYSFLYRDNPLFKLAENLYVGVAAAYVLGLVWYNTLYADVVTSYFPDLSGDGAGAGHDPWLLLVPIFLGLLILTRFSSRLGWLSRYSFAFVVGAGAGFTIPRYISSFVLAQVGPSLNAITLTWEGLNTFLVLVGVVSVLIYFFFSLEHTGVVGKVSRLGIWFLMISFGASFGYTIMARLSLLIGRVTFLLGDWLHLL